MSTDTKKNPKPAKSPAWARRAMSPPRYASGAPVSNAPMGGAADLVYDDNGSVAWDRIWDDFCDLALAGGPPHRETMLEFATRDEVVIECDAYERVVAELVRALSMVTGWPARCAAELGRVEIVCIDEDAADWLELAVNAENVQAERADASLLVPAGPEFRIEHEIKNVVTSVAKAHHYWLEHRESIDGIRRRAFFDTLGSD